MNSKWHKLGFWCPECKSVIAKITDVSFCADGGILFEGFCPECGLVLHFKTDMVTQIFNCVEADLEEATEIEDKDEAWLHAIHVKFPEKEALQ